MNEIDEIIKKHFKEHNQDRDILTDYKTIKMALIEYASPKVNNLDKADVINTFCFSSKLCEYKKGYSKCTIDCKCEFQTKRNGL